MANRFPLVIDTTDGNTIKELPTGDNLNLQSSSIVNALSIDVVGSVNVGGFIDATAIRIGGETVQPNTFSGSYTDLTDKPTIPAFSQITGDPFVTGLYDAGTSRILYANVYATLNDLPDAATYHGMFAHVHSTGKGYYSHAGEWRELANVTEIPTELTDLGITLGTQGQVLTVGTGGTLEFQDPASFTGIDSISFENTGTIEGNIIRITPGSDGYIDLGTSRLMGDMYPEFPSGANLGTDTNPFAAVYADQFITGSSASIGGDIVFSDATNSITGNTIAILPSAGNTVDLGNTRLLGNLEPEFVSGGSIGTSETPFGSVHADNITGNVTGNIIGDVQGSIFADDSTLIVDGVDGVVRGDINFGDRTGFIRGNFIALLPNGLGSVDLGSTRLLSSMVPEFDFGSNIGSAVRRFNEGYFRNINIDLINGVDPGILTGEGDFTGSFFADDSTQLLDGVNGLVVGDVTNSITKSNTAVFGDNTEGNLGYQVHVLGDLGLTGGDIFLNGGSINDIISSGDAIFQNNLTVQGNLIVNGTTTTVNTVNTVIKDNIIVLNNGETGAGITANTSGIEIDRGTEGNVSLVYSELENAWLIDSISTTRVAGITGLELTTKGDSDEELITIAPQGNDNYLTLESDNIRINGPILSVLDAQAGITGDITGSVFADDSTLLVDAVNGVIPGNLTSTNWTTSSYTNIDIDGFLDIEPAFMQINAKDGGYMQFNAGDGAPGYFGGGYITINAGDGGNSDDGNGGYIQINAGESGANGSGDAGYLQINAGRGLAGKDGGYLRLTSGSAEGIGVPGRLDIYAGSGDVIGADIRIIAGDSGGNEPGNVSISGGTDAVGNKGNVIVTNAVITGDVTGSVFADDSSVLVDGTAGLVVGDVNNNNITTNSITTTNSNIDIASSAFGTVTISGPEALGSIVYNDNTGAISIATTGEIAIQGAAGSQVKIGIGTSGNVTLGNGSNNVIIDASAVVIGSEVFYDTDIQNWDEAYSWGDHGAQNYVSANDDIQFNVALDNPTVKNADESVVLTLSTVAGVGSGVFTVDADSVVINSTLNVVGNIIGDLKGNVYADDSTLLVDGESGILNLAVNSIGDLGDVDVTTIAPSVGQVLKWDGVKWAPAADATTGGVGLDANTLDGFDSVYFLNWGNFTNTPTSLSGYGIVDAASSAQGALANSAVQPGDNISDLVNDANYLAPSDNISLLSNDSGYYSSGDLMEGEFKGSVFAEDSSLIVDAINGGVPFDVILNKPTTIAGYGITDAFDGDYNSLSNSPTIPSSILDLNIIDGGAGEVLSANGDGTFTFISIAANTLDNLDDVQITSLQTGDRLFYNGANWVNTQINETLDSVTDNGAVTDNAITVGGLTIGGAYTLPNYDGGAGQILATDGNGNAQWNSVAGSGLVSMISLSDTDLLSVPPVSGDFLNYDGANWKPLSTITKDKVEDSANWDTAYSWGDHSAAGYIVNVDNQVQLNVIGNDSTVLVDAENSQISADNLVGVTVNNWNTAYAWGDHSTQGYLTVESDTLSTVLARGNSASEGIDVGASVIDGISITGTVIDTQDSSTITITPSVNFDTQIQVSDVVPESANKIDLGSGANPFRNVHTNTVKTDTVEVGDLGYVYSDRYNIGNDSAYSTILYPQSFTSWTWTETMDPGYIFANRYGRYVRWRSTSQLVHTTSGPSGVTELDFFQSDTHYLFEPTGSLTLNFTNIPNTSNRIINMRIFIAQGNTAYIPNAVQINGVADNIQWQNGEVPTGTPNNIDLVQMVIWAFGNGSYAVLAQANSYS